MESIKIKNTLEQINSRERLVELERSGKYLFHGTSEIVDVFEPRQAMNFDGEKMVEDDKPGVFASAEIEIPIFRSIFSSTNMREKEGSFKTGMADHNDHVVTSANRDAIEAVRGETGFVYVLNKKDFAHRKGNEYIAYKPVKPVAVCETSYKDITEVVEIE